jgi:hypothetical protein
MSVWYRLLSLELGIMRSVLVSCLITSSQGCAPMK